MVYRKAGRTLAAGHWPVSVGPVARRIDTDDFVLLGAIDVNPARIADRAELQPSARVDIRYNLIGFRIDNRYFRGIAVNHEDVPADRIKKNPVRVRRSIDPVHDGEGVQVKRRGDSRMSVVRISTICCTRDRNTVRS